ncbi:catechol-2,3-dioxygenase [Curtobacterium sp. PhB130]|uniref:hypothetical protein n=1 Tax=Curtobacterium sp. PhB130 TaxID=2485178 RepID=UPI000F4C862A|nr:hypothetical protein [Curtobacterium sp. PhB130]ROS75664.1 catechol-2,3-dioxygenase [Curtobacterium sp. PhB130]
MQINEALLPVRSVSEVSEFYARAGFAVQGETSRVTVTIGRSRIVFLEGEFDGAHHLAFTIPTGTFDHARQWIEERTSLLSVDEQTEFEGPASWNSRSLYFNGPDEQVLELIERRALSHGPVHSFTAADLVCVSELGVAVPDVPNAVHALEAAGIHPYGNEPAQDFAAVGDVDGLLILVTSGRSWFPTASRRVADTAITVQTTVRQEVSLSPAKRVITMEVPLG